MRSLTRWLHTRDPTRMVAVDVWGDHPPKLAGPLYSEVDAVAETDYSGWYDYPHDTPAELNSKMRERLAAMEQTFAGKVLVISEFGAESNGLNPPGSPGSYGYQAKLLAEHIAVYEADPAPDRDDDLGAARLPPDPHVLGRLDQTGAAEPEADRRSQPEGPVHLSGQPKPGVVSTVTRLYKALPAE